MASIPSNSSRKPLTAKGYEESLVTSFENKVALNDTPPSAIPHGDVPRRDSLSEEEEEIVKLPSESSVPYTSVARTSHVTQLPIEVVVSSDEEDDEEENVQEKGGESDNAGDRFISNVAHEESTSAVSKRSTMSEVPSLNGYVQIKQMHRPTIVIKSNSERTMHKYDRTMGDTPFNISSESDNLVLPFHEKSEETKDILNYALKENYVFSQISIEQREQVVGAMAKQDCKAGEVIITKGEVGDYFYVIESGKLCVVFEGNALIFSEGYSFGEWSLIHNIPRTATCVAATNCLLWKIDKKSFRFCLAKEIKAKDDRILDILRKVPLLRALDDNQRIKLLDCLFTKKYSKGEKILKKGDVGDSFYIIKSGKVHVHKIGRGSSEFTDHHIGTGEFFGERALLTGEPRAANVTAITDCVIYGVDRESFERVVGKLELLMSKELIFKSVPMFAKASLSDIEKLKLGRKLETKFYSKGDMIVEPGKPILQSLHLIKKGQILIVNKNGELIKLKAGDYFGDHFITSDPEGLYGTKIMVEEDAECKVLSKASIVSVIGDISRLANPCPEKPYVEKLQFKLTEIRKYKLLGQGGFGKVWLASTENHPEPFALKVLSKKQLKDAGQVDFVLREKNIMYGIDHPFVMGMIGCTQDASSLYFVLPLFPGGELYDLIHPEGTSKKDHGLSFESTVFYGACLLDALQYLHKRGIAHRDMKPENVLIGSDGYCCIVDFGFAKVAPDKTFTMCGTFEYMAPEIITAKGYNFSVDCWAFAVLLFEMLVGKTPFYSKQKLKLFKRILVVSFKAEHIENESARDLVEQILVSKPTDRLGNQADGVCDILDHPFFESVDWYKLKNKQMKAPWIPASGVVTKDTLRDDGFEKFNPDDEVPELSEADKNLFVDFSEHG